METPVLSKIQNKLSLSGKKAKKEILKNVVVNPHKAFWPLVQNELAEITKILQNKLPRIRGGKINVPWEILKDVSKNERKNRRDEYIKKHSTTEEVVKEDNLVFGVNSVTKLLEKDFCSAVLVADMSPRMVVKHIVEMAVLKAVPVLVISTLKQILKDCCGLESMAIAIKKGVSESSCLMSILETIVEISKTYTPSLDSMDVSHCDIVSVEKEHSDLKQSNQSRNEQQKISNYHLIRPSKYERAFKPEESENFSNIPVRTDMVTKAFKTTANENSEYHYNMVNEALTKKKVKKQYKPLVVKRLKGNKNRKKNKKNKQ